MKIKTANLTGAALDWAVAQCEGIPTAEFIALQKLPESEDYWKYHYSSNWAQGGPIIEREGIDVFCNVPTNPKHPDPSWRGSWKACYHRMGFGTPPSYGSTPLIAAMRCYVASKLGDEVEIPKELLEEVDDA